MAPSNTKHIIKPKLNMHHLVILGIFLISSFILYRMISSVRRQCMSLKNEFESLKMAYNEQASKTAIVVNEFEKYSAVQNDDNISINSEEINTILRKINVEDHSYEADIKEQPESNDDDQEEVQSAYKPLNSVDVDAPDAGVDDVGDVDVDDAHTKKIIEIDDDVEGVDDVGEDSDDVGAYTEGSLKRKSISDLKNILKKQNKPVKGNKSELIKSILE